MNARLLLFLALIAFGLNTRAQSLVNTTWDLYDPDGMYLLEISFGNDMLLYVDVGFPMAISEYENIGNTVSITDLTEDICTGTGIYAYEIVEDTLYFTLISDQCEDRVDIFLNYFWVGDGSTSIALADNVLSFDVFPNPSNGHVNLTLASAHAVQLRVFDIVGNLVHETRLSNVNNQLDLSTLAKGSYVFQAVIGQDMISKKVILK